MSCFFFPPLLWELSTNYRANGALNCHLKQADEERQSVSPVCTKCVYMKEAQKKRHILKA